MTGTIEFRILIRLFSHESLELVLKWQLLGLEVPPNEAPVTGARLLWVEVTGAAWN